MIWNYEKVENTHKSKVLDSELYLGRQGQTVKQFKNNDI